jgi:hypothetical protein
MPACGTVLTPLQRADHAWGQTFFAFCCCIAAFC